MSSAFRLDGKRALVTGANTGIGQGIALARADGREVIAVGRFFHGRDGALISKPAAPAAAEGRSRHRCGRKC